MVCVCVNSRVNIVAMIAGPSGGCWCISEEGVTPSPPWVHRGAKRLGAERLFDSEVVSSAHLPLFPDSLLVWGTRATDRPPETTPCRKS